MRDKIRQYSNGQFHKKAPQISISVDRLLIQIEQGRDYYGSFLVTSTNGVDMKGFLQVTNPVLHLEVSEISGKSRQVEFYVREAQCTPYEEQEGEIQILTNGGEFFLPFRVSMKTISAIDTELGKVQDLYQFMNIARVNPEKALEIFKSPYFTNILLRDQEEKLFLYQQLMKSSSKQQAMAEFIYGQENSISHERTAIPRQVTQQPKIQEQIGPVQTGDIPKEEKEHSFHYRKKSIRKELMKSYLAYRTNHAGLGEYIEKTLDLLDRYEQYEPLPVLFQLLRLHMYVLSENHIMYVSELQICQEKCALLSRVSEENCYLQYIEALYARDSEYIEQIVENMKAIVKAQPKKAAPFLMLIYMDTEYANNLELQFRTIKKYFKQGLNSPLYYFEACDILNRNQDLLKELGPFELLLLNWGYRYQYLSMEVIDRFAHLSIREKNYEPRVFHLLEKFYEKDPKLEYLTAICSLIIKGNHMQAKFHQYIKKGVESNLKIIGIQEYYIRTLNLEEFDILPQELLQYFLHSGSLSGEERAYYYTNLVVNRIYYGDLYETYLPKIDTFIAECVKKGKITSFLEILYRERLASIELTAEIAYALPNLLFKKKIECQNPAMDGVIVHHMEEQKGAYYELKNGVAYVDVYTPHELILFADKDRQRYLNCDYTITSVFDVQPYIDRMLQFSHRNPKLQLYVYCKAVKEHLEHEKYMAVAKELIQEDMITSEFRIKVLQQLIGFYSGSSDGEMLDEYLRQIDLELLSGKDRVAIITLLIKRQLYTQAANAISRYGFGTMEPGVLMNLGQYLIRNDQIETRELAVNACELAFEQGRYDSATLDYLAKYYVAAVKTLLPIWNAAQELQLDTLELEDNIIALALFSENIRDVYPVFQSFVEKNESGILAEAYLQYASYQYMIGKQMLPDGFFDRLYRAIRQNMAKGPFARMALLNYYSKRVHSLDEDQIKMAKRLLDICIHENMVLPYFHDFHPVIPLPAEVLMKTVVAYYSDEDQDVKLHYNIAANNKVEDTFAGEYMREILPGIYTREFMLFSDEHLFYYITQDNITKVDVTEISGVAVSQKNKGVETRFEMLNQLLDSYDNGNVDETQQLAEKYMEQMYLIEQQIKIL